MPAIEDGDRSIVSDDAKGRKGYWYVRTDGSKGMVELAADEPFAPYEQGAGESAYSARIHGEGFKELGGSVRGLAFGESR
jgi:hypothetical protein